MMLQRVGRTVTSQYVCVCVRVMCKWQTTRGVGEGGLAGDQ